MSIGFSNIPADLRVPLFYAEMDNSAANSASSTMRRLIVGQVNDNATSDDIGSLVLVPSVALAKTIGGQGSMLAAMYEAWRKTDPVGEVWCLPLLATEGAVSTATVTLAGEATEAGLLNLYVGGVRVQATVVSAATAAQAASALAVRINATPDLPVTAAAAAAEVTLTCKWKGESGNDISLQLNRLGKTNGEVIPAGLTATVTAMAGGVGAPDQVEALAALGEQLGILNVAFQLQLGILSDQFAADGARRHDGRAGAEAGTVICQLVATVLAGDHTLQATDNERRLMHRLAVQIRVIRLAVGVLLVGRNSALNAHVAALKVSRCNAVTEQRLTFSQGKPLAGRRRIQPRQTTALGWTAGICRNKYR